MDFYHYRMDVYTHTSNTHLCSKVNLASDDPFKIRIHMQIYNIAKTTRFCSQLTPKTGISSHFSFRCHMTSYVITRRSRELPYGICWKPVIIVYRYGCVSYKIPSLGFRRHSLTHWSRMDYFDDGWMRFLELQQIGHHSLPWQGPEERGYYVI